MELLKTLADYLTERSLKLTTAESCTSGLIASMLGDCEGCGAWLECGFVTYSPEAKTALLGVHPETIRQHGLTSIAVAVEMAEGALRKSGTHIAIANTGVAGPDAAEDGTPPGTVCLAWACSNGTAMRSYSETRQFSGDRNTVRKSAARYAIERTLFYHRLWQQEHAKS
ncbi:MAG TPA: CinA family protein [Oxalicibacterium sp.]|uniref:CinA family protein n=1 Tax=Oxalicibacterium sp. TaxID=2766525 RepID=UPI002C5739F2|nr:CinA family protein [Oxalicibacterium sp.]HWU99243.1 CinA family protein [Oxalicibacterium sp.]